MLESLKNLDKWPDTVKESQRGWIGKREGATIVFNLSDPANEKKIEIFTSCPETVFGATFIAISPENEELLKDLCDGNMAARSQVLAYQEKLEKMPQHKSIDEENIDPGVKLYGVEVVHPLTGKTLPVYIASYV